MAVKNLKIPAVSIPANRIYPLTRVVAAPVVLVLLLAFVILFFFPEQSGARFAWAIKPDMMAAFMGAGYLGGALVFWRVALGGPWHRVTHGFPPVAVFTAMMLVVTVLHWDRFDIAHFPFQLWLVLYAVTPVLIPALWLWNRREDPGTPEAGDLIVPQPARLVMGLTGAVLAIFALVGLLVPGWLIALWVWPLTPLTARILAGWFALLATGGLTIALERRWSAWKIGLVSITLWHVLVLVGAALFPGDFPGGPVNWYTVLVLVGVLGMGGLFAWMEIRRQPDGRRTPSGDLS